MFSYVMLCCNVLSWAVVCCIIVSTSFCEGIILGYALSLYCMTSIYDVLFQ